MANPPHLVFMQCLHMIAFFTYLFFTVVWLVWLHPGLPFFITKVKTTIKNQFWSFGFWSPLMKWSKQYYPFFNYQEQIYLAGQKNPFDFSLTFRYFGAWKKSWFQNSQRQLNFLKNCWKSNEVGSLSLVLHHDFDIKTSVKFTLFYAFTSLDFEGYHTNIIL